MKILNKSRMAFLLALILILNLTIIIPSTFSENNDPKQSNTPESHDLLTTTYQPLSVTQYKTGNWVVNSTETYIDSEIVLTGNLIIKKGGVLTFRNTTLILNCSIMKNPIWVKVKDGGTFRIWDMDDDVKTMDDRSIITDSPNDVDDGTVQDFRYFFNVEENGTLDVNNSLIEECGKYDGDEEKNTWGLYIEGDNATIRNSTIRNGDYLIILQNADNTLIEYANITDSVNYFIYAEYSNGTTIKNCIMNSPDTYYGLLLRYSNDIKIINNAISSLYRAIDLEYLESLILINNTATLSTTSTAFFTTEIDYCSNVTIEELYANATGKLLKIYQSTNLILRNSDLSGKNMTPLYVNGLDLQKSDNITIENCDFRNCLGNGIYSIGSTQDDEDIIRILNCTFENITREAIYFKYINNFIINNCTFKNTSKSTSYQALYLWYCYSGKVSNCEIEYSGGHDIRLWYSEGIIIDSNIVGKYFRYYDGIDLYYSDNNYIINNEFSYQAFGLEFYRANNNYIHNNQFIGWNDLGICIDNEYSDNNVFINNYIEDYSTGIKDYRAPGSRYKDINITSCTSSGFNGYESNTELENIYFNQNSNSIYSQFPGSIMAKNCTIRNPINSDIYLRNGAKLIAINCTFKKTNIYLNGLTDNLFIGWWADIYVEDTNGFVPGALVTVYNNKDVKEFSGLSGADGHVILPIIQEMLYRSGTIQTIDMNPHNITAYLYPDIANVTPKPMVTDNNNYTIIFAGNTFPTSPQRLSTRSQSDDINLTWEYPALVDLQQFEIFRSLDPEDFNFNNPIGIAGQFGRSWEDTDAASDWKTYYYCIRANDTSGQLGNSSNLDRNGDWVVSAGNDQQVTNLNVELNGSILVESGGKLNLSNAKVKINHTEMLEFGVRVQSGGILKINDNDNDPNTLADASNITTKNASLPIYFIVESSGKLFMNNSIVFGIGHKDKYNTITAFGLYMGGSTSIIKGNTFIATVNSYHGLVLHDVINVKIFKNTFKLGFQNPIYMVNTKNSFIENNTILGTSSYGIYGYEGNSNNYYGYNLIISSYRGIYSNEGSFDKFESNIFDNNDFGLYIRNSPNIVIFNNTFQNAITGYGIYVYDIPQSKIVDNKVSELRIGIYISRARDLLVSSNQITNCTDYGFRIYDIPNSLIINNYISNIDEIGIGLEENGDETEEKVLVVGGNVTDCLYGIYVEYSSSYRFEGINCWNNLYGFYSDYSSYIHVNSSTFKDNFGIGVYSEGLGWSRTGAQGSYSTLLENCTLDNPFGMELGVEDGAIIWTVNISIPYNRINFKDGGSKVAFFWYIHIYAEDMFGSPAANSKIKIQQVGGEFVERSTDGNGYLYWQLLHDITSLRDGNFTSNPYTISATLGNHSGDNITTIKGPTVVRVKLDNSAPNVVDPLITPQTPYTTDDLVVTFGYSDPEGDLEFPYTIKWYESGNYQASFDNVTTIDDANTKKGELWWARIWVTDGAAYSDPTDSNLVSIRNTDPTVSGVVLSPTDPSSTTDITVSYSFNDIDGDSEFDTVIQWEVDKGQGAGFESAPVSGPTLPWSNTKKGEVWRAKVRPHDGEDFGNVVTSTEVVVGNSRPEIFGLKIIPKNPDGQTDLALTYEYSDIDSDSEQMGTYKWLVDRGDGNGFVDSGITSSIVPYTETLKGERWSCDFTPYDGFTYGHVYLPAENITIGNTPPTILGKINVTPNKPTSSDNLIVSHIFYDYDSDSEDATTFRWYVDKTGDGTYVYSGIGHSTVYYNELTKGTKWYCEVTPHDGEDFGETVNSEIVQIGNSAPSVSDLEIIPEEPIGGEALKVRYKFYDIDGDFESGTKIRWYRDNEPLSEFNDLHTIPTNVTQKGEVWYFTVQPFDGADYGQAQQSPDTEISNNVTIGNSPPIVTSVSITPAEPTNSDTLVANYEYSDADDDYITTVETKWFRNEIKFIENKLIIEQDYTRRQDVWYLQLRVFDGSDWSAWATSPPKLIMNIRPELIVTPVQNNLVINETESITFIAKTADKDNDVLSHFWYLDGEPKSVDLNYKLTTTYDSKPYYNIRIEVSDGTAIVSYEWNVTVLNKNRKPTLQIVAPEVSDPKIKVGEPFDFIISVDDPDNEDKDKLQIKWFLDDKEVGSGEKYTYPPKKSEVGKRIIRAVVTDGDLNQTAGWNVTVEEEADNREELLGFSYDFWGLVLAIISGIAAIMVGLFGVLRVRKKKGKLREYMDKIEEITDSDKRPKDKEKELISLKSQIKKEFSKGLITENHYLILERELDNAVGETRKSIVGSKIAMPDRLKSDVNDVLDDGVVTKGEYDKLMSKIMSNKDMSVEEKTQLKKQMSRWMKENKEPNEIENEIGDEN